MMSSTHPAAYTYPIAYDASAFHQQASKPGVIISTCSGPTSGCHAFGDALHGEYQHLDRIKMSFPRCSLDNCDHLHTVNVDTIKLTTNKSAWECIFFTGCQLVKSTEMAAAFVSRFFNHLDSYPSNVAINVVLPPHFSRHNQSPDQFSSPLHRLFISGIHTHNPICIGLPKLYASLSESKEILNESCYGIMYHKFCEQKRGGYYESYFQQVVNAAKINNHIGPVIIHAVVKVADWAFLQAIAQKYNIVICHEQPIAHARFLRMLQLLAKKRGIFLTDGAQSHMEAVSLGVITRFYWRKQNSLYLYNLLKALPESCFPTANVLLDCPEESIQTFNHSQSVEVTQELRRLIEDARNKFNTTRISSSVSSNRFGLFNSSSHIAMIKKLQEITLSNAWHYQADQNQIAASFRDEEGFEIANHLICHDIPVTQMIDDQTNQFLLIISCGDLEASDLNKIPVISDREIDCIIGQKADL